jgi:hypothetical protein
VQSQSAFLDAIAGTGEVMLDAAAERLAFLSPPALERALQRRRALSISELEEVRGLSPDEAAAQVDEEISALRHRIAAIQQAERVALTFLQRPGRLEMLDVVAGEVPPNFDLPQIQAALRPEMLRLARRLLGEERECVTSGIADRLVTRVIKFVQGRRQLAAITATPARARRKRSAATR